MPIYIILLYCLTSDPQRCEDKTPVLEPVYSLAACVTEGQEEGAKYVNSHPAWRLSKVRCRVGSKPNTGT